MALNILVSDDSKSLRKVLIKTIKMCGVGQAVFFEADNGEIALEVLKKQWIDIVFTDLNMPVMDGYSFLKEVRKNDLFKEIPVIVITSETREKELNELRESDATGIITKPFQPEDIRKIIVEKLHLEDTDGTNSNSEGYDF
ncbi:MAG: response regulator [Candidatus Cloacimonetes bacterium]|nr:response regulator [Candidatus Cloacimonadota bacterium]